MWPTYTRNGGRSRPARASSMLKIPVRKLSFFWRLIPEFANASIINRHPHLLLMPNILQINSHLQRRHHFVAIEFFRSGVPDNRKISFPYSVVSISAGYESTTIKPVGSFPRRPLTILSCCSGRTCRQAVSLSSSAVRSFALATSIFALAISFLAVSASLCSAATCNSRACFTAFSKGLSSQSAPNSIATPIATNAAATSFATASVDSHHSAPANAEASIERSRFLSLITLGLVAVWLCLRILRRQRRCR